MKKPNIFLIIAIIALAFIVMNKPPTQQAVSSGQFSIQVECTDLNIKSNGYAKCLYTVSNPDPTWSIDINVRVLSGTCISNAQPITITRTGYGDSDTKQKYIYIKGTDGTCTLQKEYKTGLTTKIIPSPVTVTVSTSACISPCSPEDITPRCEGDLIWRCIPRTYGCYQIYTNTCGTGYTCNNGQCGAGCTNQCTQIGLKECILSYTHTCGNYDDDSCLEWSTAIQCPNGCSNGECNSQTCTEQQGGSDCCMSLSELMSYANKWILKQIQLPDLMTGANNWINRNKGVC